MPCYRPLSAWQLDSGAVVFVERGSVRRALTLPCGQCIGCRLERSRQWAVRCMHESQMHDHSCFITLTYDNDSCPLSLDYSHFQKFLKRLRKRVGKARFFMCGEYGEQFLRPHFHACLFGIRFPDAAVWRDLPSGSRVYRSAILESLWPYGYSSIGDVTFESAAYVARYCVKKVTGPSAEAHYTRVDSSTGEIVSVLPEFCHMSLKPGVGSTWFDKFKSDVFPRDFVVMRGKQSNVPRYYDKRLAVVDPWLAELVPTSRDAKITPSVVADSTPDRLFVRETVARAGLNFKKRIVE